jgi:hypothetical protein
MWHQRAGIGPRLRSSYCYWVQYSASQAAARWRLDALRRRLGGYIASLPTSAAGRLNDIENRIMRQDVSEIDELFKPFEPELGSLRTFSDSINDIDSHVAEHEKLLYDRDFAELPIKAIVRAERRRIDILISREWPWQDTQATLDDLEQLGKYIRAITHAFDDKRLDVLDLFRKDQFEEAYQLYKVPSAAAATKVSVGHADADSADAAGPAWLKNRQHRMMIATELRPSVFRISRWSTMRWMTERPRALAAAASVLVVAIVGLQLQYLNSTSFFGSLSDWLGLLLWSAIVELSGVSVLDVVGRLSGGGPAPRPSRP